MSLGTKEQLIEFLQTAGVTGPIELATPPSPIFGDFSFSCFGLSKERKQSPQQIAIDLTSTLVSLKASNPKKYSFIGDIEGSSNAGGITPHGPYVNFLLNGAVIAQDILGGIEKSGKKYGTHKDGGKKKIMVEFAHPNTHKAFHIGHLRNIITGESIVRLLENAGYKVVRANYQGDVGMHIAKCLWGVSHMMEEYESAKKLSLSERAAFLGRAYAKGSQAFEESETAKGEIVEFNDKIYSNDRSIRSLYKTTRKWSLQYFDTIYKRVGSHFDRLYFESETYKQGIAIVQKFVETGVFRKSEGAIIYPGSEHGLHDRVFINSKGFPTYEAKDVALAALQFKEYKPERIIHVVAREQTEYFKVVFRAIEDTLPVSKGKEFHLSYGWVQLKEGKMSSRTGNVVLGEWLLDEAEKGVLETAKESAVKGNSSDTKKIALAAVKYGFLKTGVHNDIAFDIHDAVNLTGDSGPYLLYIVARINSILRKAKGIHAKIQVPTVIEPAEKQLLLKLAEYSDVAKRAAETLDPSQIAKYLFDLAQLFNTFYHACPVLQVEDETVKQFRLQLIRSVATVMTTGLGLLGIETVEEM